MTTLPARRTDDALAAQVAVTAWHADLALAVRSGELSPQTERTYRDSFDVFLGWLQNNPQPMTPDTLRRFRAGLLDAGYSEQTVNLRLSAIRRFFEFAHVRGYIEANPAANLKGARRAGSKERHSRDALSPDEVRRVLSVPDRTTISGARDYLILCLMAYGALRTIEVHRAMFEHLRQHSSRLVLDVQGKGSKPRDMVLSSSLVEALYDWRAVWQQRGPLVPSLSSRSYGNALSTRAIRQVVVEAYKAAGIKTDRKTTHSLRHSAASAMVAAGVNLPRVAGVLGHADLETTMIYYHDAARMEAPPEDEIVY